MDDALLLRMLRRGDKFSVRGGLLHIEPKSGDLVPELWMRQIRELMFASLPRDLGCPVFRYAMYTTGCYDVGNGVKKPGISLQFESTCTGHAAYVNFNVELARARTTPTGKKGTALPGGQFRVGRKHAFTKFWSRTALPLPRRLTAFHDYMGKLGSVFFIGTLAGDERIDKASLRPLELSPERVRAIIERNHSSDKSRTTPGQVSDKPRTRLPDKETRESQEQQRIQLDSSAGAPYCGNKVKGNTGMREPYPPELPSPKSMPQHPQDQSHEDWWREYDGHA